MQHILTKYGFQRCGIIYVKNGTERIAYQMERLHGGVEESDRTEYRSGTLDYERAVLGISKLIASSR